MLPEGLEAGERTEGVLDGAMQCSGWGIQQILAGGFGECYFQPLLGMIQATDYDVF